MYRKAETFLNMAAEVGGRGGKGGMVHGVRSLGSATLDLAYCAMGSFDIWWEGVNHAKLTWNRISANIFIRRAASTLR